MADKYERLHKIKATIVTRICKRDKSKTVIINKNDDKVFDK